MNMKRNRRGASKERIIMLTSAVLVMTALTVTGVLVRNNRQQEEENNIIDFSALESGSAENGVLEEEIGTILAEVGTDDLDYDPYFQEANSTQVTNNASETDEQDSDEQTDDETASVESNGNKEGEEQPEGMIKEEEEAEAEQAPEDTEAIATTIQPILDFTEQDKLVWPIVGDILINYSMDKTIYFPTLDQYKYHPAIVIAASQGETITAAANGRVVSVNYDSQLGNTVVMDLGNNYELTYGQLDNITVSEGSYVATGDIIGNVASPTKYYSTEGANVYFKLTKDGEPVNPMSRLE